MANINRSTHVAVLALFLVSASSGAAPRPGDRPVEDQFEVGGKESPARESGKAIERILKSTEEREILRVLTVQREEIVKLLAEFKAQPEQHQRLMTLLKESVSSQNVENIVLVRSYIRLMSSAVGSFHLLPVELGNRISSWSPTAKAKLASVIERAHLLAMTSKAGTREQAFRMALKEAGLEEKYEERCRKR